MAGLNAEANAEQSHLTVEEGNLTNQINIGIRQREMDQKTDAEYYKLKTETLANTEKAVEKTKTETERLKVVKEEHEKKQEEIKEVHIILKALQQHIEESKVLSSKLQQEVSDKLKEIVELEAKSEQCYQALGEAQENHNQVRNVFFCGFNILFRFEYLFFMKKITCITFRDSLVSVFI